MSGRNPPLYCTLILITMHSHQSYPNLTTVICLLIKIVGNKKSSLLIVSLLAAMPSFAVNIEGTIIIMKVTTSHIPHHLAEFSFAMCHPPLSQEADGFQLLVDSRWSKHSIDPKLICGVESKMLEHKRIEPPMEVRAAGNNVLRGTAQGIC